MTPEQQRQLFDFINLIADGVAAKLSEKLAAMPPQVAPQQSGPKAIEVSRTEDDGSKHKEVTTLPDLIAELNDHVRMQTLATELLIQSLNDNTRATKRSTEAFKQTTPKT